ncbi:MAG: isocitrate/isopropylmalate dehydrogenase family protein [Candidatus Marsarchaeota archaeon]|nr:isocitrate/isopropylmalate dehydrogenase family protein [Candidatus Marsarchaeota archaeon]MCL5413034.1 isocitrate/isopropylmalate dehydrogenase family protein [Candidatus Marsarchaeota archaeon]
MPLKKSWRVAVLPGDGTGPELIDASMHVLDAVKKRFGISITTKIGEAGFHCMERYGTNLPDSTVKLLKGSDCAIKGPMTTPEGAGSEVSAAVKMRKMFDLYANVRPAKNMPGVDSLKKGVDLVIVRENTEGMYSGLDFMVSKDTAIGLRVITRRASERIGRFAFELAMKRKRHLTIVHKGNILKMSDALFKGTIMDLAGRYVKVAVDDAHVDAMSQWLIKVPERYDVIVTENLFGDILSDESAMLVGGLGTGPSANIGDNYAMFEPIHGSAPKYTGMDRMNPVATIMSIKMMFEWMGYKNAAAAVEVAVLKSIRDGVKTVDLGGNSKGLEVGKEIASNVMEY